MMIVLPLNFRVITAVSIVLICVMVYYSFIQEAKPKKEYAAVTGTIALLSKRYHQLPLRDAGKFRYVKLDNSPFVYELFTGNDFGDFSPTLNRVDALKQGDKVTLYAYESNDMYRDGVNRNTMFIDKDGISYFEKGNSKKALGIVIIVLCFGLIVFSYIMWRKGKMRF